MKIILRLLVLICIFVGGFLAGGIYFSNTANVYSTVKERIVKNKDKVVLNQKVAGVVIPKATMDMPSKTEPVEKPKVEDGRNIFTVQVASFKDLAQAKQYVDTLSKEDYDAYIAPADLVSNKGWYRVCIGESIDKAQAFANHEKLKAKFKGSFVQVF